MPMVRNSVRLTALIAALALAGCGSDPGTGKGNEGNGNDCDPDVVKKGCVAIMNFRSTTETLAGVSIPARHPGSAGGTAPGLKGVMLSDSSLNSIHAYEGTIAGQSVSVKCTITNLGWISVNPSVIIQQEAFGVLVNCSNW
jgi:hypothetical protein